MPAAHSKTRVRSARPRIAGTLLVVASALMFSLSGVLTKSIEAEGWTILCWRGLIGGLAIAAYVALRRGSNALGTAFGLGTRGWLLASVGSLASIAFIYAFKLTYVANVTLIYATAPFMAAALGWWLLRETVPARTLIAGAASLAGVVVVVAGGSRSFSLGGDLLAVAMTLGNAVYIVLIRRFRSLPVTWAGGASALQLFVLGCVMTDPLAVSPEEAPLLILFGLTFAAAVVLWTEGTRLIPAAQSGLLGTVDTPLAILLAWLVLAEIPPESSLLGGAVVLLAVLGHAASDIPRTKAKPGSNRPRGPGRPERPPR